MNAEVSSAAKVQTLRDSSKHPPAKTPKTFDPSELGLQPLGQELLDWFKSRGISHNTLERNGIQQKVAWSKKAEAQVPFAAFPFFKDGQIGNVKYRSADKVMFQVIQQQCCVRNQGHCCKQA